MCSFRVFKHRQESQGEELQSAGKCQAREQQAEEVCCNKAPRVVPFRRGERKLTLPLRREPSARDQSLETRIQHGDVESTRQPNNLGRSLWTCWRRKESEVAKLWEYVWTLAPTRPATLAKIRRRCAIANSSYSRVGEKATKLLILSDASVETVVCSGEPCCGAAAACC